MTLQNITLLNLQGHLLHNLPRLKFPTDEVYETALDMEINIDRIACHRVQALP